MEWREIYNFSTNLIETTSTIVENVDLRTEINDIPFFTFKKLSTYQCWNPSKTLFCHVITPSFEFNVALLDIIRKKKQVQIAK